MANVSQVCRDTIAASDAPVTLDQLMAACESAGCGTTLEKLYASVQSLASRREIGRAGGRTYCRLDGVPDQPTALVRGERGSRKVKAHHPPDVVLAAIAAALGPSVPRPRDRYAWCVVLLGDHPADFILLRARSVLEREPDQWFEARAGDNVMVGFLV